MTERLADISARIDGIRQLGAVVNAMKGIAAARARVARTQIDAVDSYAATIAAAMASALGPGTKPSEDPGPDPGKTGLLAFCAEQGFAGAFSERVLDSIGAKPDPETLFLIGTRGIGIAAARGLLPVWSAAMPSHTAGIPKLADRATRAIYHAVGTGRIDRLDVVFTSLVAGRPTVARQTLFPIDLSDLPAPVGERPLMQIPVDALIDRLGADYFHALVCRTALHAFAAENEARMEAMAAAGSQIARELETFEATLRRVRQEAITEEIIELGTGAAAAHDAR
ncbi:F0F1 ATP synthase subunit gamma [Tropicimonas sp. IMCC34043]|uniref:F0F1 ATP synthase subunit gamma n=1 Tax=Tropicimonas sp. IMCC34043 TaxID=2248760 RepID=UPI000E2686F9|nr:F0F1 ATP synthase subunit gamma [Tropicimonas sp. IMCC34043]